MEIRQLIAAAIRKDLSLAQQALMYLDARPSAYRPFVVIPDLPDRRYLGCELTMQPTGDCDEQRLIFIVWGRYDGTNSPGVREYVIQLARFLMVKVPRNIGGEGFILQSLPDTVSETPPAHASRLN